MTLHRTRALNRPASRTLPGRHGLRFIMGGALLAALFCIGIAQWTAQYGASGDSVESAP